MKNCTESGSVQFSSVRFPELDDRAHVDTDDMKMSLLSLCWNSPQWLHTDIPITKDPQ